MEPNLEKKSDEGNHHQEGPSPMTGTRSSSPLPPPPSVRDGKSPEKIEEAAKNINDADPAEKLSSVQEKIPQHRQDCDQGFPSGKDSGGHVSGALDVHVKKPKIKKSEELLERYDGPPFCGICVKEFPSRKSLFGHMRNHPERVWRVGMEPPASGDDGESEEDDEFKEENSDVLDDSINVKDGVKGAGTGESPEKMELDDDHGNQELHDSVNQLVGEVKRDSLKKIEENLKKDREELMRRKKSSAPNAKFKDGKYVSVKKMKFAGGNDDLDSGKALDGGNLVLGKVQKVEGANESVEIAPDQKNKCGTDDQIKLPVQKNAADGSSPPGFTDGDHENQTAGSKEMDVGGDDSKGKENIQEAFSK